MKSVLYTRSPTFRSFSSAPNRVRQARDELADAGAVDERHLGEVEEDPSAPLREQLVDRVAQDLVAQAGGEPALEVDDDDVLV